MPEHIKDTLTPIKEMILPSTQMRLPAINSSILIFLQRFPAKAPNQELKMGSLRWLFCEQKLTRPEYLGGILNLEGD